jgi:hypothetical protein
MTQFFRKPSLTGDCSELRARKLLNTWQSAQYALLRQTCQNTSFQPLEVWWRKLGLVILAYPTSWTLSNWDIVLNGANIQGKKLLYYPHKLSFTDLRASAQVACPFCTLILHSFLQDRVRRLSIELSQSNIILRVKVKPVPGMSNGWTMENSFLCFL